MEFYRIQSGRYVFYAKVLTDESISVFIGSKTRPMYMLILIDASSAILQSVSYDERCSSNEPMPRKIGTRAMVNGALTFIKWLFPNIEHLSVTDEAVFECNGKKIPNSNMSFILHGQTWYERYFHAEPVDKENYEELKRLYYHSKLHDTAFQRIWDHSLCLTPIPRNDAMALYKSSTTWSEFYTSIYKVYQCVPFIHITVYSPFALFSPRKKTLVTETWTIPLGGGGDANVLAINGDEFPEMDWKPLKPQRKRLFGGLMKVRRYQQMYIGDDMDEE